MGIGQCRDHIMLADHGAESQVSRPHDVDYPDSCGIDTLPWP